MMIRVLGVIAVDGDNGVSQAITSPRQRLVLAILAANHGSVVPAQRLIELIWPEDPPRSAETSLHVTVSQLRKLLEPERAPRTASRYISTSGNGYRLDVGQDELDLTRFTALARLALTSTSDDDMAMMSASWAEPPFAEFCDASWARSISNRLHEQRLAAVGRHAVRTIRDRRPEVVIPTLTAELGARPHEERLAGLLMLALARQGRQADALSIYEQTRSRLREDLGLEPTAELRSLERSILEHDPGLFESGLGATELQPESSGPLGQAKSTLIGRTTAVEEAATLIENHPMVTIVGTAGAGKTSLAREVQAVTTRRRTYFVDLTSVATGERVARAIADAIGLFEEPNMDTSHALAAALGQEPSLVVLDNCEELLDGVASIARALCRSSNIRILATSRRLIGLSVEKAFKLEPLELPGPDATIDEVREAAACRLLSERSGLRIDDENAAEIAEICRLLDGLPLALELGAYRLRSFAPAGVLRDLREERDLEGPVDVAVRRRSLDGALDRSIRSLPPTSREVLDALAVFAGPVPVAAIDRMVVGTGPKLVAEAVGDLVARNLVTTSASPTRGPSSTVFGLLETVRAYGRRAIARDGGSDLWRRRHVEVVADVAQSSRSLRSNSDLVISDLTAEIGRALDYLETTADDGETHHKLVTNIGSFWYRAGRLREAHERMRTALDLYPDVDPLWRGVTLAAAGLMSFSSGEFRQLDTLLTEAIDVLGTLGMPGLELLEAAQFVARRDLDRVEERISLALASRSVAGMQRAIALDVAAYSAWFGGNYELAVERFAQQEDAAAAAGDVFLQGRAIRGRGLMLAYQGNPESGALLCQTAIEMIEDWENDRAAAQCMAIRAAINFEFGRLSEARQDALGAIRRATTRFDGNPMMVAIPIIAVIEARAGRHANAARLTGWIRGICAATGMYLPAESERHAASAEAAARDALSHGDWGAHRSEGAAGGLAALVTQLERSASH